MGVASIGPCPFRHGKYIKLSTDKRSKLASIGPCPFRHGKPIIALPTGATNVSFNWTMSFQTW